MKIRIVSAIILLFGFVSVAKTHEAPVHGHTELIPIPAYTKKHGPANAKNSLKALKIFLSSFDENTKKQMIFGLDAPQRKQWSNLPAGSVTRAGISVGEMSDEQRVFLFDFLSSSLSKGGYEKVMSIMAAEAFLSDDRRAKRLRWAPENYWISFYGTPSEDAPWGWLYGGHHLGLNVSVRNNTIESISPSFLGTEPAVFTFKGVDYEVIMDMHLAAYGVYDALDNAQKSASDAVSVPRDIVSGPGKDGFIPDPIGLSASKMNTKQRDLLLETIGKWVSVQPDENARTRMAQIKNELDQTTFAWIGSDKVNTPCYMRIQGPSLIIELQSSGGNIGRKAAGKGHYHTIYRNPTMEYGIP